MKNMIYVDGGGLTKKGSKRTKAMAKGIVDVFEAGRKNRMDQTTVQQALNILARGAEVTQNTHISGCNMTSHTTPTGDYCSDSDRSGG